MSRRTPWSLYSESGILSAAQRRRRGKRSKAGPPVFDDHVQRIFTAQAPNRVWLTDIIEHRTIGEGKLCCCAIKDLYANRIVGYSISDRMTAQLAVDALNNAVTRRGLLQLPPTPWRTWRSEALRKTATEGQPSPSPTNVSSRPRRRRTEPEGPRLSAASSELPHVAWYAPDEASASPPKAPNARVEEVGVEPALVATVSAINRPLRH